MSSPSSRRPIAASPISAVVRRRWCYDGDGGDTILFGNGTFGAVPVKDDHVRRGFIGSGFGARGNVASDAISTVSPAWAAVISEVSTRFPRPAAPTAKPQRAGPAPRARSVSEGTPVRRRRARRGLRDRGRTARLGAAGRHRLPPGPGAGSPSLPRSIPKAATRCRSRARSRRSTCSTGDGLPA